MEEPGFLESIATLPPDQQQAAFAERKQAYIADLVGSGRLTQAQVPLLMGSLRVLDDERNASMARRRDRQFDAKTNTLLADAAKTLTDAMSMGEEEQQVAALTNAKSLMATLSATRKDVARTKLLGVVKDTMITRIEEGDLSEGDALEELAAIQDAGLLDGEQQVDLERVVAEALSQQERKAQDPIRSSQVDRDIAGILAEAIAQQEIQNGGEPLTDEQLQNVVNGRYEEIAGIYRGAGLRIERTRTAINDAKRVYRGDREARRSDDRDVVVSLDNMVVQLDPKAREYILQSFVDKKITGQTKNRLLDEVEQSTDPEQISSNVARFLRMQSIPAGLELPGIQKDLEALFAISPGTGPERYQAMREKFPTLIQQSLQNQPDSLRTDRSVYWLSEGRSGRSGAINAQIERVARRDVEEYYPDRPEDGYVEVLDYIFNNFSEDERKAFRRLSESDQQVQINEYILGLRQTKQKQALQAHLKDLHLGRQKAKRTQAITGLSEKETEGQAIPDVGQANMGDALVLAQAAVAPPTGLFAARDSFIDTVQRDLEAFSDIKTGGNLEGRLPPEFARQGYTRDASFIRALALVRDVSSDGVRKPEFSEFPNPESAEAYLGVHILRYGVPLDSLASGRHLTIDLSQMGLTWDSSPYFDSPEDLQSHVFQNEEGEWKLSDRATKAFRFLGLNTEQETIQRFHKAQSKLTSVDEEAQKFLKRMRMPDLQNMRREDGLIRFRTRRARSVPKVGRILGESIQEEEFRLKVMGDK
jgi:hypothetical protein